jgi:hypothetical protein
MLAPDLGQEAGERVAANAAEWCERCQLIVSECSCELGSAAWREPPPARAGRPLPVVELEPAAEIVEPPRFLCDGLLYRGAVHCLSGPPDSGKTTLACWWMLQAVRDGGRVLFLDEEGGRPLVVEKFQALGAIPGERIGYVPFPGRSWAFDDVAMLAALISDRKPAVIAWDSSAAFMARAGLDENAAADVTGFYSRVLMPAARLYDAAVLVIDHDTKSAEPSRYARGSGAKLAATDVAYKIAPVKPFSKTQNGLSKLLVTKDRRGWLHRSREVTFRGGPVLGVEITEASDGQEDDGLAPAERKVLAALTGEPSAPREIVDRIAAKHGHGLARETVSRALNRLLQMGLADMIERVHSRGCRQALTGAGSQGFPVRAAWMASMGRMPWLRLVTR